MVIKIDYFIKERKAKPLERSWRFRCKLAHYVSTLLRFKTDRPYKAINLHNNVYNKQMRWGMIQMTLARIVKALEFTAMITQTSWIQNIVIDTIKEWGYEEHLHFGHTLPDVTVIQVSYNVDLLWTNAKLERIMRIMEISIWLLDPLFVLSIQIFDINIWLLAVSKTLFGITKMISKSRNHVSTASRNLLYFTL